MLHPEHLEIVATADGSTTLRQKETGITYRSTEGARGECLHVFYEGANLEVATTGWSILELGLGSGMNFLTTADQAMRMNTSLHYVAVDKAPIPSELVTDKGPVATLLRDTIQRARETRQPTHRTWRNIRLTLHPFAWQHVSTNGFQANAIFHDPFGPDVNPDCWTLDCFTWSRKFLHPRGRLVTYSAAGHVRRSLGKAGYFVAIAPGYGKKREMTVASPTEDILSGYRIKVRP